MLVEDFLEGRGKNITKYSILKLQGDIA